MTSMDAPPDVAEDDQGFSTEYEMGQDNIRPMGLDIHNPVFLISSVLIFAFVLVSLANQEASAEFFGWLRPWLTSTFDWFLVLSVNAITLFCLALIGSASSEGLTLLFLDIISIPTESKDYSTSASRSLKFSF